ncbi:hypothetical protein D3C76_1071670 [compost metagenome]
MVTRIRRTGSLRRRADRRDVQHPQPVAFLGHQLLRFDHRQQVQVLGRVDIVVRLAGDHPGVMSGLFQVGANSRQRRARICLVQHLIERFAIAKKQHGLAPRRVGQHQGQLHFPLDRAVRRYPAAALSETIRAYP